MAKISIKDLEAIPATRAKILFGEILHQTSVEGRRFVIDRHGKPVSVILSYREYRELVEAAQSGGKQEDPEGKDASRKKS
jgi:prevent-host-death family protein